MEERERVPFFLNSFLSFLFPLSYWIHSVSRVLQGEKMKKKYGKSNVFPLIRFRPFHREALCRQREIVFCPKREKQRRPDSLSLSFSLFLFLFSQTVREKKQKEGREWEPAVAE